MHSNLKNDNDSILIVESFLCLIILLNLVAKASNDLSITAMQKGAICW